MGQVFFDVQDQFQLLRSVVPPSTVIFLSVMRLPRLSTSPWNSSMRLRINQPPPRRRPGAAAPAGGDGERLAWLAPQVYTGHSAINSIPQSTAAAAQRQCPGYLPLAQIEWGGLIARLQICVAAVVIKKTPALSSQARSSQANSMPLLPAIQMSRQNRLNHAPFRIMASRFSVLEKGLPSCSTFRPCRISSCMAQIPPCMGAERVRSIQQVDAEEKLCPWNGSKTASNLPL